MIIRIVKNSSQAIADTFALIRPGLTERQLAALLDRRMVDLGAERPAFETIVASGPNGAIAHHAPTDRPMRRGDLIVHEDLTAEVIAIFDQLLQLRYPIEKIRTVDNYPGADDELSMEDNNTSAFNCREIPGTGSWSQHALGRAIDLNPLLNPEIDRSGAIQPKTASPYRDRRRADPGILHAGDVFVRVFTDRGWRWGGDWRIPVDYQHFER